MPEDVTGRNDEMVSFSQPKCSTCNTMTGLIGVSENYLCEKCLARFYMLSTSSQPDQKKQKTTHSSWQLPGTLTSAVASSTGTNQVTVAEELAKHAKPQQREGVEFIWKRCFPDLYGADEKVGGCILAHHMGLGKSLTTIILLHAVMTSPALVSREEDEEKKRGKGKGKPRFNKVLLVAPTNTLSHWKNEIQKWTELLPIPLKSRNPWELHYSCRLREVEKWGKKGGVLIVGETLFQKSGFDIVKRSQPDILVLDEAHTMLKNTSTKLYKTLECISTSRKILLTGSPMQNNVTEFYNMIEYIRPGIFGVETTAEFENKYRKPIERGIPSDADLKDKLESREKLRQIREISAPYIHRRAFGVLRDQMPPFTDIVLFLQQSCVQAQILKSHKKSQQNEIKSKNFLASYAELAPVLNHPGCLKIAQGGRGVNATFQELSEAAWLSSVEESKKRNLLSTRNSPKFIILAHILAMAFRSGEKTLIFSKCLKTLDLLELFLSSEDWKAQIGSLKTEFVDQRPGGMKKNRDYLRLDGSVDSGTRGSLVDDFNEEDDQIKVFLISSLAGGTGINLCGASLVVMMDNHFNQTVAEQCIARAYRYGQTKRVRVYRLAIEGTVEDKIYKRSENKAAVATRVIDGLDTEFVFSTEELNDLQKSDVYAVCRECDKRRWLLDDQDPPAEGEHWKCTDNRDPAHNRCEIPEERKGSGSRPVPSSAMDPILLHLSSVVNVQTRKTPLVTLCLSVGADQTEVSLEEEIVKLKKEIPEY